MILNAASCGTDAQIEVLVRQGAMRALYAAVSDPTLMGTATEALEKFLQVRVGA